MNTSMRAARPSGSIQGQLLRMSEHRAVAIYLREGSTWVADFVDGQGVLVDVDTWFRFNCGSLGNPYVARRIALESALPLPVELVARIEALHHTTEPLRPRIPVRWISAIFALLPRGRMAMLLAGRCLARRPRESRS
ncbi:MAG: hypothetical protein ABI624_03545 [Casimicrobiaceae bacterium]